MRALRTLVFLYALLVAGAAQAGDLDKAAAGNWDLPMDSGKWVWVIKPDGSYAFHSEAGDSVAAHEGTVTAHNGKWILTATNGWADGGSYAIHGDDAMEMSGKLGTATWVRHGTKAAAAAQAKLADRGQPVQKNYDGNVSAMLGDMQRIGRQTHGGSGSSGVFNGKKGMFDCNPCNGEMAK